MAEEVMLRADVAVVGNVGCQIHGVGECEFVSKLE